MQRLKIIGLLILLVSLGFLISQCRKDDVTSNPNILKPGDNTKIVVDRNSITTTTRDKDGKLITKKIDVPKDSVITLNDEGVFEVKVRKFGLEFSPGIGAGIYDHTGALLLDFRLMYYKQLGLHLGNAFQLGSAVGQNTPNELLDKFANPYIALGYRFNYSILSNTSLLIGYGPIDKQILAGIRVSF